MGRTLLLIVAGALSFPASALGEGIPIEPGEWKVSTRVSVSIAPEPRLRESTQCMVRDRLSADELTGRSGLCDNEEIRVSGNTMTWKITCRGQMEGNSGEGTITMNDGSFTGEMKLLGVPRQNDFRIVVTTLWQGQRLGDCE